MKHSVLQSVVFPKDKFSAVDAVKWLSDHKLKASKIDETPNTYRFRQHRPIPGARYYTKTLPNQVEFIIAVVIE